MIVAELPAGAPFPGSFEQWGRSIDCCLRNVARSATAYFQEPTDPANNGAQECRRYLAELYRLREAGRLRGWTGR